MEETAFELGTAGGIGAFVGHFAVVLVGGGKRAVFRGASRHQSGHVDEVENWLNDGH